MIRALPEQPRRHSGLRGAHPRYSTQGPGPPSPAKRNFFVSAGWKAAARGLGRPGGQRAAVRNDGCRRPGRPAAGRHAVGL